MASCLAQNPSRWAVRISNCSAEKLNHADGVDSVLEVALEVYSANSRSLALSVSTRSAIFASMALASRGSLSAARYEIEVLELCRDVDRAADG